MPSLSTLDWFVIAAYFGVLFLISVAVIVVLSYSAASPKPGQIRGLKLATINREAVRQSYDQKAQFMSFFHATYMTNCSCRITRLIVLLMLPFLFGSCGQKGGLERPQIAEIFEEKQLLETSYSYSRD